MVGRRTYLTAKFLSHSASGRTVIVFQEDEDFSILDLLLMAEIETTTARPSNSSMRTTGAGSA